MCTSAPDSKRARLSVPWANEEPATPAPQDDTPILEVDEEDEHRKAMTAELGACQQVCGEGLSSDWHTLYVVVASAARAAGKTKLSYQSDSISLFLCS